MIEINTPKRVRFQWNPCMVTYDYISKITNNIQNMVGKPKGDPNPSIIEPLRLGSEQIVLR